MHDLTARVLNAIPAGAYEMNALLGLLRIEETDAVPTASVSCEQRPVLRINPEFVRRHCRTDEHLFLLVMHELHHVLLGHTRLFPTPTRVHNVAFDALINSMLILRFPGETYRSFFPPPETPIRGRSLADELSRADVRPEQPAARVLASLRRALLGAATKRTAGAATSPRVISVLDAVPTASDRRAAVARSVGYQPLLYWRPSSSRRGRTGHARVYIDVSGSMAQYVPFLYGALVALRGYVEREVFLFSTAVRAISLQELQQGRIDTTGGTDIQCVMAHALAQRLRRILIVTDGYVGAPAAAQAKAIRRSGLDVRVALTPGGWRNDLQTVSTRMDELPVLAPAAQSMRRAHERTTTIR
jgi:hypothetical protein